MKLLLSSLFVFSFLFASEREFSKGWSLVSLSESLKNMDDFKNENVEIIWAYDATDQVWKGYSSDEVIRQKIADKNISTLKTLEPYQSFWILSKEAWTLSLEEQRASTIENETLLLKKGWNLISLPQRVSVDSSFFSDALVWKYNEESGWCVNDATFNFPKIEDIKESDALWVKSESNKEIDMSEALSKLRTFNFEDEMLEYIDAMLKATQYYDKNFYYIDTGVVAENSLADTQIDSVDATVTNLQELGVDESDILKSNEEYIFSVDRTNSQIFISSFSNIASQNYKAINKISTGGKSIVAMYLQENSLVLISNSVEEFYILDIEGSEKRSVALYPNSLRASFNVEIYDISTILDIKLLASYQLDGYYSESRVVDKKLFLMSSFYPESENLQPYIKYNGVSKSLLSPATFYAPIKLNQTASITTLSSFTLDDASFKESLSFVGNAETYYASATSLYLVSNEYPLYYDYYNYQEQSMIYKFGIGERLEYKGRGFVEGRVLNQFSMSEKDDYLRVATSSGFSWSGEVTQNSVFTMKEEDEHLEIQASLNGLGKEGEVIKAVRFMDERGFIVTFKESDPLYTLDMSDPLEPKVVGELSIPGFSRYLHIVDENRVLSIGRDADESGRSLGLILQLFDISDFSNPLLADKIEIGDALTYSSAEYNHKALSYRSSDLMFALPYSEYNSNSYTSDGEKLGIYKVDSMKISEIKTIISERTNSYNYDDARGLIFDLNSTTYGVLIEGSNIVSESLNKEEIE